MKNHPFANSPRQYVKSNSCLFNSVTDQARLFWSPSSFSLLASHWAASGLSDNSLIYASITRDISRRDRWLCAWAQWTASTTSILWNQTALWIRHYWNMGFWITSPTVSSIQIGQCAEGSSRSPFHFPCHLPAGRQNALLQTRVECPEH